MWPQIALHETLWVRLIHGLGFIWLANQLVGGSEIGSF